MGSYPTCCTHDVKQEEVSEMDNMISKSRNPRANKLETGLSVNFITFEEAKRKLESLEIKYHNPDLFANLEDDYDKPNLFYKKGNKSGKTYLLKEVDFLSPDQKDLNIWNEIIALKTHDLPHFNKLFGYTILKQGKICFIYFLLKRNLRKLIETKTIPPNFEFHLGKQLIELIIAAHSKGLILLDISINTVGITEANKSKFFNLGNISPADSWRTSFTEVKHLWCYAPEILGGRDVSWQADIYSLGATISMVLSCTTTLFPTVPTDKENLQTRYMLNEFPTNLDLIPLSRMKSFCIGLLRLKSSERPTIFQIAEVFNSICDLKNLSEYKVEYSEDQVKAFTDRFFS